MWTGNTCKAWKTKANLLFPYFLSLLKIVRKPTLSFYVQNKQTKKKYFSVERISVASSWSNSCVGERNWHGRCRVRRPALFPLGLARSSGWRKPE